MSGGATKVIQNKVEGKDATEGLGTAMLTGAVAGGVGASVG